jgi:tRNA nucleotidyltransferase (CCA-adding enzyme)
MARANHVYPQVDGGAAGLMDRRVASAARGLRVGAALVAAERAGAHVLVLGPRVAVRQAELARAARWGLRGLRAVDIAWHDVPVIAADTPEIAVRRLVLAGASMLLVRDRGRLVGVVDGRAAAWARPALSVAHRLEQPGDPPRETAVWLLRLAGKLGETMGVAVWAAGGFVRDLLRDAAPLDIDLVVEGDGPAFARRLADEVRGRVTVHRAFGSASVEDGRTVDDAPLARVDIATARRERYAAPGALPSVEGAPLAEDLLRRDFTINALAIALGPAVFGRLVDAAGGQRDLDRRRLVPLQPLAFVEDPTRIFRAARYVARLGFQLDAEGRRALRLALDGRAYPALSGQRLLAELALIVREPARWQALALLLGWGAFRLWDRGFRSGGRGRERLRAARRLVAWMSDGAPEADALDVALLALLVDQPPAVARRAFARLGLGGGRGSRLADAVRRGRRLAARLAARGLTPSRVAGVTRGCPTETLLAAWLVGGPSARRRLQWFLREGRHVKPGLGAEALIAAGIPRGPGVGRALRVLRNLRLDGRAGSLADEQRFVKRESARYRKGESQ